MKSLSIQSLFVSFLSLMVFWVIMSGFLDIIHLSMGALSVAFVLFINHRFKKHRFFDDETDVVHDIRFGRIPFYFMWMVVQIIKSAIQVARVLLSPSLPIETQMIRFKVNLPNAHAKMILGNSITLTPGTLTLDIEGDVFFVHALVPRAFQGIVNDKMPHQVLKLFSDDVHPVVSDVQIIKSREQL